MEKAKSSLLIYNLIIALISAQLFGPVIEGSVIFGSELKDQTCSEVLVTAEKLYYNGQFDLAIETVKKCLREQTLPKPDRIKAYTILARAFFAKDQKEAAIQIVMKILELQPGYQPTIEQDTPQYVNLVAEVRHGQTQKVTAAESGGNKWIWIGAGGAVLVAAAVYLLNRDDGGSQDEPLPGPPDFPDQQ